MKRWVMAGLLAFAFAGLAGCDEDDEESSGGSANSVAGTWNGTMVATRLMGQPVEESDVVPFTMNIKQTGEYIDVTFQANGYPGFFTGHYYHDVDRSIDFSTTADYTYSFFGNVAYGQGSMSGMWVVNIPGGMSGTWQASR